jgi:hypothetical protein
MRKSLMLVLQNICPPAASVLFNGRMGLLRLLGVPRPPSMLFGMMR